MKLNLHDGRVSKWLKGADCKSVQLCCSLVRIQSLPLCNFFLRLMDFHKSFFCDFTLEMFVSRRNGVRRPRGANGRHKYNGRQRLLSLRGTKILDFAETKKDEFFANYFLSSCLMCDRYFVVAFNAELKASICSLGILLSDQLIYFLAREFVL